VPSPEEKPESRQDQPKEPVASITPNLTRAPKTTSLKTLAVKEPEAAYQLVSSEKAKLSTPFSAADLIRYWDAYAETLEEKVYLKNTMINCKPALLDQFNVEVIVHNPAQREELMNNCIKLLEVLRHKLKNDCIQIRIRIDDTVEKKPAYTSAEKFDYLNELNPLLSKLKEVFDLEID
jgi:DNA polymerase-3 subunit gamma/tau